MCLFCSWQSIELCRSTNLIQILSRLLVQLINNTGFECERHLYRALFEAILSTPQTDTNRLNLFQQLYSDLGNLFEKPNFASILQYSLQTSDQQNNNQSSAAADEIVPKICDLSKCLKLSELQKLAIFVGLGLFEFDKHQPVDLKKCRFQSDPQLTQFLLTKLLLLTDQQPNISELLNLIQKGKRALRLCSSLLRLAESMNGLFRSLSLSNICVLPLLTLPACLFNPPRTTTRSRSV